MDVMADTRLLKMKFIGLPLIAVMIAGIFLASVVSSLNNGLTIQNSGTITPFSTVAYQSEIRGVFIHAKSLNNPDWSTIASTLASYGINVVAIEWGGADFQRYPTNLTRYGDYNLSGAVAAFHAKDILVYADMNVMMQAPNSSYADWFMSGSTLTQETSGDTNLDPTNPLSLQLLKSEVQQYATNFAIDGFMIDYVYYDYLLEPLSNYSRDGFIGSTGLTNVSWPSDVVPTGNGGTGLYYNQFMEWRVTALNNLVQNITTWIHAVNPSIQIAATAFDFGGLSPYYWRFWEGLDPAYWISQGWIHWIAPMMYTNSTSHIATAVQNWQSWAVGGLNGIVPLAPFITNQIDFNYTTQQFSQVVNTLRANGANGWIIWEYGGPGDASGSGSPDIRPYLSAIGLPNPPTFTLGAVSERNVSSTSVLISWSTSLPATSNVEYSTSPLFNASYAPLGGFHYWQMNYAPGAITGDNANVTSHSITLANLTSATTYYLRVQSQDPSGTATSEVLNFRTA